MISGINPLMARPTSSPPVDVRSDLLSPMERSDVEMYRMCAEIHGSEPGCHPTYTIIKLFLRIIDRTAPKE